MKLIDIITYLGIFIFAITGALKARTYRMDIFGAIVLAFITSYGGGTLRDLLIGRTPVNWINDNIALTLVFAATAITFFFQLNFSLFKKLIFYTDTLGLGLFTAVGIEVASDYNINSGYAVVMGVITATFGGLIADIFCNAVPNLLKRGELYATACAIGGVVYVSLRKLGFNHDTNLIVCILLIAGIRIYSKRKRLMLPEI